MAAKKNTKRMSHTNCTHPKTSHERAKCRSRRNQAPLTSVPTVPPTVDELAAELSASLTAIRHAESRVESLIEHSESIQEQLLERLVNAEPKPTADGENPVVTFKHHFRKGGLEYEYAAIGIPEKFRVFRDDCDPYQPREVRTATMWYLTSSGKPAPKRDWKGLIQFIGAEDLGTLKVLRSG
nr:MAG TPA: hypothetical protein [Caudoviricetes sp.]